MASIPFFKAHGALNDFLLTWAGDVPDGADFYKLGRAICHRNSGVGADGWMIVAGASDTESDGSIQLINSDGSPSEISGNGTRCAAALLVSAKPSLGSDIRIRTGAGVKRLALKDRHGNRFLFEMNMGEARFPEGIRSKLSLREGEREVTIVNAGNPQCVVFVPSFAFDWRGLGAEIERHPYFPSRTNVSFVRAISSDRLEVRFYERGAGETQSSGTGSTGAAAAARARGLLGGIRPQQPVTIETPAGPLQIAWKMNDIYLTGPAELTAQGVFYWNP
jgi:diaminopimelate epimerase